MKSSTRILSIAAGIFVAGLLVFIIFFFPREITRQWETQIDAPSFFIKKQLEDPANFDNWLPWAGIRVQSVEDNDHPIVYWKMDDSGLEGKMKLPATQSENSIVSEWEIPGKFNHPVKNMFSLNENDGQTSIEWEITAKAGLLSWLSIANESFTGYSGIKYQDGLRQLKMITEAEGNTGIVQKNLGEKTFLVKKLISGFDEINEHVIEEYANLKEQAEQANIITGDVPWALHYEAIETGGLWKTQMSVAIEVLEEIDTENLDIATETIHGQGFRTIHAGPHYGLDNVHANLHGMAIQREKQPRSPVLEKYHRGPIGEKDAGNWITEVWLLFE